MKNYLPKNTDQVINLGIDIYQIDYDGNEQYVSAATLSSFDAIRIFLWVKDSSEPFAKYSTETVLPSGYITADIQSNRIEFTIRREDTKSINAGDVYFSIQTTQSGERFDSDDYIEMSNGDYLTTLTEPVGYNL